MPSGMGAIRRARFVKGISFICIQNARNTIAFRNVHLTSELDFLALMPVISIVAAKAWTKFWDLLM
jgi:hypothetical protein